MKQNFVRHPHIDGKPLGKASKKSFWTRKRIIIAIVIAVFVVAGGVATYFVLKNSSGKSTIDSLGKPTTPVIFHSPLTGVKVDSEATTKRPVTAIMIENSPDARPQSGLKDAGVIFEAVAEGGITRFVALYQEAEPSIVGPVRSARPYYVEWAAAFDPAFIHVGGSDKALQMLNSGDYGLNIDEVVKGDPIYREAYQVGKRVAPHNAYTDYEKYTAYEQSKGKTSSTFTGFARADGKAVETPDATEITMPISVGIFNVTYKYDAATNTYLRYQGGAPHLDREKGQIAPSTAIAMMVDMSPDPSDGYHQVIRTTGNGEAFVFQNGTVIRANWYKPSADVQIRFTDGEGKEIKLTAGKLGLPPCRPMRLYRGNKA